MKKAPFRRWIVWIDASPVPPGRAERHGFEYYRHGTLSLFAALNPRTGDVIGQTAARHTRVEFVALPEDVVSSCHSTNRSASFSTT